MEFMLTPQKLKVIRTMRGLTQAQLAEASGVGLNSIASFEAGTRDIRASTIRRLCDALDVEVIYRVDGMELEGP